MPSDVERYKPALSHKHITCYRWLSKALQQLIAQKCLSYCDAKARGELDKEGVVPQVTAQRGAM